MANTISYLRVSTDKQNVEKNKAEILKFANEKNLGQVKFVEEVVSGTVHWKERAIGEIIFNMKEDDCLIVSELSRLGRSMLEIIEILSVATSAGIRVFSVKGAWALDNSLESKIMAMVFSIASEIERTLLSERITEALKARKAKGLRLGRPKGKGRSRLDKYAVEIQALLAQHSSQRYIANRYEVSEPTLSHWIRKNEMQSEKKAVNF